MKAVAGWLAVAGALYGVILVLKLTLPRTFYERHRGDFAAGFLLAAYLVLFAALWLAFGGAAGLRDRLGFRVTAPGQLLAMPLVWVLTLAAGTALTYPFIHWFGPPKSNATALVQLAGDPFSAIVIVAAVTVVAPICEELLFRGALFGWLRGRVPVAVAVPVSAAVFAGAHVFPSGLVLLFVFGVSAALVYQRTGSTLNSAVMHACQNTLAVVVVFTGAGATPR